VLDRARGGPGHIFNLGHGVLPETDPDVLGRVRELVHAETRTADPAPKSHTSGTPA
jgi:uroporphyrinogen decarboxylase